jgi:hypothetical protein
MIYLAQTDDPGLTVEAMAAADRLGLSFERRMVGYGELEPTLVSIGARTVTSEGGRLLSNPPTSAEHATPDAIGAFR